MRKFNISDEKNIFDHYKTHGYVVIEKAISHNNIDSFITAYKKIRHNPLFVYYSQSLHIALKPVLNKYAYIKESMENASRLVFFKKFSKTFQSCIYAKNVSKSLSIISQQETHISWQNMFFDQSVGTIEHQDSWYLDTDPAGNLIGVWYALEDIHENSGPFFVIPGSHKIGLLDRNKYPKHDDFVNATKKAIKEFGIDKKSMCLKKGDILLWHPYLIHGAFQCEDESKSRKSFTSHFYPSTSKAKNTLSIRNHKNPRKTENKNIYAAYRFNDYLYNIRIYVLYIKHSLFKNKLFSMRREHYSQ